MPKKKWTPSLPIKPTFDDALKYDLVQDPPDIGEGICNSRSIYTAQQNDPACQEVLSWFGGDLTPACTSTLLSEETEKDTKWFAKR